MGKLRLRELGKAQTGALPAILNYYASGQRLRVFGGGSTEVFGSWAGDTGRLVPGLTNQATGCSLHPHTSCQYLERTRAETQVTRPWSLLGPRCGCLDLRLASFGFRLPA